MIKTSQAILSFSSVGSNSSSYYRSSYLDSSPSNSSYSSTYNSYPSYESKYQALLNRNPDGAGKSRSGEFPAEIRVDMEVCIMQELPPSTTICQVMQQTPVKTRLRTTGQPPTPASLTQTSWLRTILRNITTNLPPLATVFWRGRSGQFRSFNGVGDLERESLVDGFTWVRF